jgi:zinc protease
MPALRSRWICRRFWLVLGPALFGACAAPAPVRAPAQIRAPAPDDPGDGRIHVLTLNAQLKNGLRVVGLPDGDTSLVEVAVRYQVGSKEDPPGKAGLAHLVEHLTFQQWLGEGEETIESVLRRHTLSFNAYTSHAVTHYRALANRSELEKLIWIEARRLADECPTDATAFQREREVVRNEMRQRRATPDGEIERVVREALYPPGHAYARDVGGDDAQLASITLADVCAFKKQYYVPGRASLILAGGIGNNDIQQLVVPWMAPVPARQGAPLVAVAPLTFTGKTVTAELDVKRATAISVWALPRTFEPGEYHARFLSRFLQREVEAAATRAQLGASVTVEQRGGDLTAPVLVASVTPAEPTRIRAALAAVDEGLTRIFLNANASATTSAQDLFRLYRKRQIGALVATYEPLSTRADLFGDYLHFFGFEWDLSSEVTRYQTITSSDVTAAGLELLDPRKRVAILVSPREGRPFGYARSSMSWSPKGHDLEALSTLPASRALLPVPERSSLTGRAHRTTLENGVRVWVLPVRGLPRTVVRLVFGAGSASEAPALRGASLWLSSLWPSPGRPAASSAFNAVVNGADFDIQREDDSTTFSVGGLSEFAGLTVEGFGGLLAEPWLEEERFAEQRRALAGWFGAPRTAEQRFEQAALSASYGSEHPYAAQPLTKTLLQLNSQAVQAFVASHFVPSNATLIVVGDVSVAELERLAQVVLGSWKPRPVPAALAELPIRETPTRWALVDPGSPLLRVSISFPARRRSPTAAGLVLTSMLRTIVGEIRDVHGASYGVACYFDNRRALSNHVVSGAVDGARAGEALRAMRQGIERLRGGEELDELFFRQRRRVLRSLLADRRSLDLLADRLENEAVLGLSPDWLDRLVRELRDLKPEAVRALAADELRPQREVMVLMGDRAAVDAAYAAIGVRDHRLQP